MMSDFRASLATLGLSSPMALEGFLEAAPDAIVVIDWSGNIVIVNQLAERLFGYQTPAEQGCRRSVNLDGEQTSGSGALFTEGRAPTSLWPAVIPVPPACEAGIP
jgi:PAS domain-containing protein